jgi:DNA-binding transcriptional MerR regulator
MEAEIVLVEVPEDEFLFQKQYYSISEVAQWFSVNNSLLRFWENEFDILKPRKTRKGDRLFRPEDVKSLQLIYYLLRQRKFSIEGAKQYLKENKKKADVQMQLMQSLTKIRAFLLELKANLGQ